MNPRCFLKYQLIAINTAGTFKNLANIYYLISELNKNSLVNVKLLDSVSNFKIALL